MNELYRRWNNVDDSRFVRLYAEGKSFPEIAAAIGRSPMAVRTRGCKVLVEQLAEVAGQRQEAIDAALRAAKVRVSGRVARAAHQNAIKIGTAAKPMEKQAQVAALLAKRTAQSKLAQELPHTFTAEQDERLRDYMAQDMGLGGAAALLRIPRAAVAARWAELQMAGVA